LKTRQHRPTNSQDFSAHPEHGEHIGEPLQVHPGNLDSDAMGSQSATCIHVCINGFVGQPVTTGRAFGRQGLGQNIGQNYIIVLLGCYMFEVYSLADITKWDSH
jgi:hypothetical protein